MSRTQEFHRFYVLVTGTVFLTSAAPSGAREPDKESPRQSRAAAAAEKVKPSLVYLQDTKEKVSAMALGVIIDSKGTVVTNHSAVKGMKNKEALLNDGRRLPAKILLTEADVDLAILKIEDAKPLPHADFGDSDKIQRGDWVVALSSPWTNAADEPLMAAVGLIGGKTRTKKGDLLFLVDTSLGPGCNPGPLITVDGKFIGLVVSRELSRHPNGAVPCSKVRQSLEKGAK